MRLLTIGTSFAKKVTLVSAGMAAFAVPCVVGMINASRMLAQSRTAAVPKFEVASIKPCNAGGSGRGRGEAPGSGSGDSPGKLHVKCGTVEFLVQQAYYIFASGVAFKGNVTHDSLNPIEGGPAWIKSARYDINATAEGTPTMAMMRGPMMQALLEDRFKLKIHRETRDVPAYALTVAKNGLKLQRRECTPQPGQRLPNACGNVGMQDGVLDHYGISMTEFSQDLRNILNRPIIDKTGVTGIFDFHLKYLANEIRGIDPGNPPGAPGRPPASDSAFYPSIFTAVQEQLGLKLEQARGPDEFLVIDQVEKPSDN